MILKTWKAIDEALSELEERVGLPDFVSKADEVEKAICSLSVQTGQSIDGRMDRLKNAKECHDREEESSKSYGDFTLKADEFEWAGNGDLRLFANKRLNFYKTSVQGNIDYSIEFKNMFENGESEDGKKLLFSRSGGVWNIAAEYKDREESGDLIIKAAYFEDKPEAFTRNEDGTLTLSNRYFSLRQQVLQPQSAMVITCSRSAWRSAKSRYPETSCPMDRSSFSFR